MKSFRSRTSVVRWFTENREKIEQMKSRLRDEERRIIEESIRNYDPNFNTANTTLKASKWRILRSLFLTGVLLGFYLFSKVLQYRADKTDGKKRWTIRPAVISVSRVARSGLLECIRSASKN